MSIIPRYLFLIAILALATSTGVIQAQPHDPVIAAAGDIACDLTPGAAKDDDDGPGGCKMAQTAALVAAAHPDAVLTLGDEQYPDGTLQQFQNGYDKSWGAFKAITHPAPGNHEYHSKGSGYYGYFGPSAGDATSGGYYSFDLGAWHLIALNGNCDLVGGCADGSPQERWLRADLAKHPAACTLAYWHQPRFSSGPHHSDPRYGELWTELYKAGADVVLAGHDHDYERFAPQRPDGAADPAGGIVEFIAGTGGKSHYTLKSVEPNSEKRDNAHFGVLVMTLHPSGYSYRFVTAPDGAIVDSGTGRCHRAK